MAGLQLMVVIKWRYGCPCQDATKRRSKTHEPKSSMCESFQPQRHTQQQWPGRVLQHHITVWLVQGTSGARKLYCNIVTYIQIHGKRSVMSSLRLIFSRKDPYSENMLEIDQNVLQYEGNWKYSSGLQKPNAGNQHIMLLLLLAMVHLWSWLTI